MEDRGQATPDALVSIALHDVRLNLRKSQAIAYFGAGAKFGSLVYSRDIALSGILSLNRIYPRIMADSLGLTRRVFREAGLLIDTGRPMPNLRLPWVDSGLWQQEFLDQYHTNPFDRRTDDVVWLWAAADLLEHSPACGLTWQWVHDTGVDCFNRFYDPLFDPIDGLYRGQVLFFDIPFPDRHTSGYPWHWAPDQVLNARSLSTNTAYYMGLRAMAQAAKKCGATLATDWNARADALADGILRGFDLGDGRLSYLRSGDGRLEPHRDALGTALVVLAGLVTGNQARKMIDSYPMAPYGVPLLDPPRSDNDWAYHNRSAWPFVDAFFYWAADVALGDDATPVAMQRLAATAFDGRTFREFVPASTRLPSGSASQLWSAAGYLNAAIRNRLLGPQGTPIVIGTTF